MISLGVLTIIIIITTPITWLFSKWVYSEDDHRTEWSEWSLNDKYGDKD